MRVRSGVEFGRSGRARGSIPRVLGLSLRLPNPVSVGWMGR